MKPSEQALRLQAGAVPVAGYRLVERLGAGGFGEVWKAEAAGGFHVALKFVPLHADGSRTPKRAAEVEQRALAIVKAIRHPNLLTCFGAWTAGGYLIVAMELADRTLWDRFEEAQGQGLPGIPNPELLTYLEEAAKGLDHLNAGKHAFDAQQQVGVQHRDVKPQNILLVGGGVKVADFGLARLLHENVTGHTGSMTVAYAAPEFFENQTSSRSDQYSLAATYCHLRGGRPPFEGPPAVLMHGHLHGQPDLAALPEAERPALARALAKKPEARWPCCGEFVAALRASQAVRKQPATGATVPAPSGSARPVSATEPSRQTPARKLVRPRPRADATQTTGQAAAPRRSPVLTVLAVLGVVAALFLVSYVGVSRWGLGVFGPQTTGNAAQGMTAPDKSAPLEGITNSIGMKLVLIPAGSFTMGSPKEEDGHQDNEYPPHEVEIKEDFYLGQFEVTVGQFRAFVRDQNPVYQTEAEKDGKGGFGFNAKTGKFEGPKPEYTWQNPGWGKQSDEEPVVNVTWNDAVAFCAWLTKKEGKKYRLPTEAEWEHSCRAHTTTRFHSGNADEDLKAVANIGDASLKVKLDREAYKDWGFQAWDDGCPFTAPAGKFKPNAFGLYDMHGNVREWCQDVYAKDYYKNRPKPDVDPLGPEANAGASRVIRGGAWNLGPGNCRAADRFGSGPSSRNDNLGFRVYRVR